MGVIQARSGDACPPEDKAGAGRGHIAIKYLREHPETRHLPAASLRTALITAKLKLALA